jgi:hypothetical protein
MPSRWDYLSAYESSPQDANGDTNLGAVTH